MNETVISLLPQAPRVSASYATIARLDGRVSWRFLVMPLEIGFNRPINYSPSGVPGRIQRLAFGGLGNWVMSVNSLPLSTRYQERSLSPYINSIANLAEPDKAAKSPPILLFRWAEKLFSPCLLSDFSYVETWWHSDGSTAEAKISFSLTQIPASQVVS